MNPTHTVSGSFEVRVLDVNETVGNNAPYDIVLNGNNFVEQNEFEHQVIGQLQTLDFDDNDSHHYEILNMVSSDLGSPFFIDEQNVLYLTKGDYFLGQSDFWNFNSLDRSGGAVH